MKAHLVGMAEGMDKPLLTEQNKFPPVKQIYAGFEIEKRFILLDMKTDHTRKKNGVEYYDEVLANGTPIKQGYIHDIEKAKEMLADLGIAIDFRPNTIRLRKYGAKHILTLKDRKETKKREVEWELDRKQFAKWWPETKGSRVEKKRLEKKIKGHLVEIDAFTDRYLLVAEIEVDDEAQLDSCPKLGYDVTGNSMYTNKKLAK